MRFLVNSDTLCKKGQIAGFFQAVFSCIRIEYAYYRVDLRSQSAYKKCRPEKTLCSEGVHAVIKDIKETHKTLNKSHPIFKNQKS